MALTNEKVDEIWTALQEVSYEYVLEMQARSVSGRGIRTSEVHEFFVEKVRARGGWSREEVQEAWLYSLIELVFTEAGVRKRIPLKN